LGVEQLEAREVPALVPTAAEQLFLERLNDARANPAAYGASIGLNLGGVAASQPLAFDTRAIEAARAHALDMSNRGYFDHDTLGSGAGPGQRLTAAGFNWNSWGESIAAGYPGPEQALAGLIIDSGVPDLGHRRHLLAIDAFFQTHRLAGVGVVQGGAGPFGNYYTIDTGSTSGNPGPFLTGSVFNDANGNGRYDLGEGLAGVTIAVNGASTTTWESGGYTLALAAGTYTVTASGGGLAQPVTQTVTVGSANARANFALNDSQLGGGGGAPNLPISVNGKVGVLRGNVWSLDTNGNHVFDAGDETFTFGLPSDQPLVGDWDGDGDDDVGLFRNVNGVGQFILDTNGNRTFDAGDAVFFFGLGSDRIVIGDWDGAGRDKVGVFRNNGSGVGVFSLDTNGNRSFDAADDVFLFGLASDTIVIGDWDGDGRDNVGVFRNNGQGVGIFSLDTNGNRGFDAGDDVFLFGLASDTMVIGDWNEDNRDEVGVFRNNGSGVGVWSQDYNGNRGFDGADLVFLFGTATDRPLVGKW
jgi:uncharacterized protein YkwD